VNGDRILEVYWADVLRPKKTVSGVLLHIWYLINAMVDVAVDRDGRPLPLARAFRWSMFTLGPGGILFTAVTAMAFMLSDAWWLWRAAALAVLVIAGALATRWLCRLGSHYRWLWLWVVLTAIQAVALVTEPAAAQWLLAQLGPWIRLGAFLGSGLLLMLAVIEGVVKRWRLSGLQRHAYAALLYIPYLAMNALTSWVTLLSLSGLRHLDSTRYAILQELVTPPFDLARLEWAATCVLTILGLTWLAVPVAIYAWRGRHAVRAFPGPDAFAPSVLNAGGRGAQDAVAWLLVASALALSALGAWSIYVVTSTWREWAHEGLWASDVIEIYRVSVWRTLPLLAWLVGPFAVVLDVVGDVVYYLHPGGRQHPAALRETCEDDLQCILPLAFERGGRLAVVAHSQGSVVAAPIVAALSTNDPLFERLTKPIVFATVGSPLSSLYRRFLGRPLPTPATAALKRWFNLYRDGDYIGGPLGSCQASDLWIGAGGHVDYWSDPRLGKFLRAALG
jgi:hypothetical protein